MRLTEALVGHALRDNNNTEKENTEERQLEY
jgi:hypothetical protein